MKFGWIRRTPHAVRFSLEFLDILPSSECLQFYEISHTSSNKTPPNHNWASTLFHSWYNTLIQHLHTRWSTNKYPSMQPENLEFRLVTPQYCITLFLSSILMFASPSQSLSFILLSYQRFFDSYPVQIDLLHVVLFVLLTYSMISHPTYLLAQWFPALSDVDYVWWSM